MPREKKKALEVKQWMPSWSLATWGKKDGKPNPPKSYYVCSIPLTTLRALSGINPRTKETRKLRSKDAGYQRAHERERSEKIARYLEFGYPLSSSSGTSAADHQKLINPGWLPTAILVNVLGPNDERLRGSQKYKVNKNHIVHISRGDGGVSIEYPTSVSLGKEDLPPLEIIDGQHRLLAIDLLEKVPDDYEVPVVLFDALPTVWQAYLFWVINVEPKKINPSLAFDLYPELRNQDWLERGESIKVYQEHRAQELAEALWKHPLSPWYERIELFGKRIDGHVSNAAAIRSLSTTFIRRWGKLGEEDEIVRIGGLFGSLDKLGTSYVLPWKRSQQAAFLITCWQSVQAATKKSNAAWVKALKKEASQSVSSKLDPAFHSGFSLLATDQGFRAVSFAYNALCQSVFDSLGLPDWFSRTESEPTNDSITECLKELGARKDIINFLDAVGVALVDGMDWRTSSAPGLDPREIVFQGQYRGSSGYAALNKAAIKAMELSSYKLVKSAAKNVIKLTGWDHGK